jgi:hypothetical protein
MRVAALFAACGWLLMATGTAAQVTGVVTQAQATLQFDPRLDKIGKNGVLVFAGQNETGLVFDKVNSSGAYVVTAETKPDYIVFSNGSIASGGLVSVTTTTSIAVTFTNTASVAVRPELISTIDPAGLGLYLANTTGCDQSQISACPQVKPGTEGFGFLSPNPDGGPTVLGGASVSMTISDNFGTLKSLSAGIELDGMDGGPSVTTSFSDGALGLKGFGLSPESDGTTLVGYQWDATDLLISFPTTLAPGASDTLTYTTTVTSYTSDECDGACTLVAYAGFGDPIGKGGGGGNNRQIVSPDLDPTLGADGVEYGAFGFAPPTFSNGDLDLPTVTLPAGVVPEPASWGLMLAGFGGVGLALRRRSARQVA